MLVEITRVIVKTLLIYGTEQPQPLAAIELIHKQPVRWSKKRVTSCDGGGGPLGHPRIFINLDKPQVHGCTYCGLPFVRFIRSRCSSRKWVADRFPWFSGLRTS